MTAFKAIRITTLVFLFTCTVIVMGISGHMTRLVNQSVGAEDESVFNFFNSVAPVSTRLALAVSSITLAFLLPLAFADIVIVELLWTFTLEALWLSAAAYATAHPPYGGDWSQCTDTSFCREDRALQAFAHMSWIVLFLYNFGLIIYTISKVKKGGNSVLTSRIGAA